MQILSHYKLKLSHICGGSLSKKPVGRNSKHLSEPKVSSKTGRKLPPILFFILRLQGLSVHNDYALQLLFAFPTLYCFLQRFPLIIGKEISDIGVVFKLPVNFRFPFFLIFKNLIIGTDCFLVGLPRITF